MQNTLEIQDFKGIDWKIDEEFKNLIIPHSEQERRELENSISEEGVRDKIVLWEDNIIDGHMRYEIAKKLGKKKFLQFVDMTDELKTREDVKNWIIRNQCARRNLNPETYKYYIGKLYNERKMSHGGDRSNCQSGGMPTSEKLAKEFNKSARSIERAGELAEVVDRIGIECGQEEKNKIIRGETRLPYDQMKELSESENIKKDFESIMAEKPNKKSETKQIRVQKKRDNKPGPAIKKVKCPHCGEEFYPDDNIISE
jgi:hypothetical protein